MTTQSKWGVNCRKLEYFYSMSGKVNRLGQKTTDVIRCFDKTEICYMQLEKGFTGIKSLLSKRGKR